MKQARAAMLLGLLLLAACDAFTDGATRLAYALEDGSRHLGTEAGARYSVRATPAQGSECAGPYRAQFDKAGALIVWCRNDAGDTVSSHSTSYHARFVDTPITYIVDKPAGVPLLIDLERRDGKAVIAAVS